MITEEMISDLKSHSCTMMEFCTKYDCKAEVFAELCQYLTTQDTSLTDEVEADVFLAGFIHDELGGELSRLASCDLSPENFKTQFYQNGSVWKRVFQLVWPKEFSFMFGRLEYAQIFSTQELFGRAMPKGFTALRRAGASEELVEKGRKLARLRNTIGNIMALPPTSVDGCSFRSIWRNDYPARFDKFFDELMKSLDSESATYHKLIQLYPIFFAGGKSDFLKRHFLQNFSRDMGEAYMMRTFTKEDANADADAYLESAEVFIDAAIKVIESRAERIVACLRVALKEKASTFGLTL